MADRIRIDVEERNPTETCSVSDCTRPAYATALCNGHYLRLSKTGSLSPEVPLRYRSRKADLSEQCTVEGCDRDAYARNWCGGHYQRWSRVGDVQAEIPLRVARNGCSVDGCTRRHMAKGYCSTHYTRWLKHGTVNAARPVKCTAERQPLGYSYRAADGYVHVKVGTDRPGHRNGWMAGHRVVMEEVLGRALLSGENVHHVNGVRHDNRPENLELWISSQPSGQRVADLVAWAREILDRYDATQVG